MRTRRAKEFLVNGSNDDATGMTVEKCIQLAQGWQYAVSGIQQVTNYLSQYLDIFS